ncbi:MAG: cytochrome c maturation protein CcmE [Chloroflexi bacterium]|nr:cytochrome c maturation protein CcmE [Chloroflexota bacterium]
MKRLGIKPLYLYGVLLILGFAVYGASGMKDAITPYVSIPQAMQRPEDRVQVKGSLDKASVHGNTYGQLIFSLLDFKTKRKFTVVFSGQHPANMQMARDVVAMGNWDEVAGVFKADQMNIKCPDKYQPGAGINPTS